MRCLAPNDNICQGEFCKLPQLTDPNLMGRVILQSMQLKFTPLPPPDAQHIGLLNRRPSSPKHTTGLALWGSMVFNNKPYLVMHCEKKTTLQVSYLQLYRLLLAPSYSTLVKDENDEEDKIY